MPAGRTELQRRLEAALHPLLAEVEDTPDSLESVRLEVQRVFDEAPGRSGPPDTAEVVDQGRGRYLFRVVDPSGNPILEFPLLFQEGPHGSA